MRSCLHSPHYHTRQRSLYISGLLSGVLLLIGICFPHIALAQFLAQLTEGSRYDNCSVSSSPDGKTIFKFRAQLKSGYVLIAEQNKTFASWGTAVFFYDRSGNIRPTPSGVTAKMNQVTSSSNFFYQFYPTTVIYSGPITAATIPAYANNWHKLNPGPVDVEITVNSSELAEFPAIAVAMAISDTSSNSWMDRKSPLLTENETGGTGACTQIDIGTKPPPLPSKKKPLTIKAPDWDFGELKPNDSNPDILLAEKLCLKYEPAGGIYSERLLLRVSNQNGTTGQNSEMFKLVHRSDSSAVIPYSMRLLGIGIYGSGYRMPSSVPASLRPENFDRSGETCFIPTYTTRTTTASKPGDYMDTITFTIVNAP